MERTTFLEYYRICVNRDGAPRELGKTGSIVTYKALDERTDETVELKLIPVESVDPSTREEFEQAARGAERLTHINVAKVLDFGCEEDQFVYVSERVHGDRLDSWVAEHGPMPPEAVLHVATQVVSALSTISFHRLSHGAVQPSNLVIVPGSTPEGNWPFIKLINLGLAGFKFSRCGETDSSGPTAGDTDTAGKDQGEDGFSVTPAFASPESRGLPEQHGKVDFGSEIYSLGATMYFLLTGGAPSEGIGRRQLRMLPKALRNLLGQMLQRNPAQRPRDPVALAEAIHGCLLKIERRRALAQKFGIPFMRAFERTRERRPMPLLRGALAMGSLLLAAALVAGVVFQEPLARLWQSYHEPRKIGILVGVPDSSPAPAAKNTPTTPVDGAAVLSQAAKTAVAVTNQPAASGSPPANSSQGASPNPEQTETPNAPLDAAVPPANSPLETLNAPTGAPDTSAQANTESQLASKSQSSLHSKRKHVASLPQRRTGSMHARVVGATPDGRLIMRLPSGRAVIVTPGSDDEEEFVPHRYRRRFIDRGDSFGPPPGIEPDFFPYD